MKYQTVLFDMDGTLLDTLTDMEAAVNHILTQYGYPVRTLEEVRRFVGNGAGLLIHRALPQGVDPAREAEVLARRGDLLPQRRQQVERLFRLLMAESREEQERHA